MENLLIIGVLFLAFSNGANDNFKGFATVWGSGTLNYRTALKLSTAATIAGSLCSMFLAEALAQQFSGRGLVPDVAANAPQFILSISIGAALTVFTARRAGLPVSTTHALIGGLVGSGLGVSGGDLHVDKLMNSFLLPLLVSPLLAAMLGWLAYRFMRLRPAQNDCACLVAPEPVAGPAHSGVLMSISVTPAIVISTDKQCDTLAAPVRRFSISRLGDRLHIFSATLICFARGVNDTPKLAGLMIAAHLLDCASSVLAITVIMAAGGLIFARRVAHTMSHRMTRIDNTQGLAANLITALLVLFASKLGLPVSTTHVSVGSIAGVGAGAHTLNRSIIRNIVLSWLATLPLAAALAWLAQWTFRLADTISR
jgi:PiT family inorganic phosphate transporter